MKDINLLNPLMESLRSYLMKQIGEYAGHLHVPSLWLLQFLNSNSCPEAEDARGLNVLANGLAQFSLRSIYGIDMPLPEAAEQDLGAEVDETHLCATCAFENLRGKLDSYYDFYAALIWPDVIGKPDDWEMQTGSGTYSRADFREYVRSTVPQERQAEVFGETA